jgi:hypothetical protein
MYFNQKSINRSLENQNSNLSNQIQNLHSQLSNLQRTLHENIELIKKEQNWTNLNSYKLLEYDQNNKKVKVQVSWAFKELATNSKVHLLYSEKNEISGALEPWNKEKSVRVEGSYYKSEIYLSPDKNYTLRVQADSPTGTKGDDLIDIDINKLIEERFSIIPGMEMDQGPRYENHLYVINNFEDADFLGIKSATVEVYVKEKLENTIELQKIGKSEMSEEVLKKYEFGSGNELWSNDNAIWVRGEENWIKTGENQWEHKGQVPHPHEIRFEVRITDNMGKTYERKFAR